MWELTRLFTACTTYSTVPSGGSQDSVAFQKCTFIQTPSSPKKTLGQWTFKCHHLTYVHRASLHFKMIEKIQGHLECIGHVSLCPCSRFTMVMSWTSFKNMGFQGSLIYDTINRGESINMKWRKFTRWLYSFNFYASTLYHYNSIQLFILLKLVKLLHLRIYGLDSLQIWNIIICELYSKYGSSNSFSLGPQR